MTFLHCLAWTSLNSQAYPGHWYALWAAGRWSPCLCHRSRFLWRPPQRLHSGSSLWQMASSHIPASLSSGADQGWTITEEAQRHVLRACIFSNFLFCASASSPYCPLIPVVHNIGDKKTPGATSKNRVREAWSWNNPSEPGFNRYLEPSSGLGLSCKSDNASFASQWEITCWLNID